MHRYILPFAFGFVLACCLFAFCVVPHYGREKHEHGRKYGEFLTKLDLLERIPRVLGDDYKVADGYHVLFEVKDGAVVVVERNGVKTLRVYDAGK